MLQLQLRWIPLSLPLKAIRNSFELRKLANSLANTHTHDAAHFLLTPFAYLFLASADTVAPTKMKLYCQLTHGKQRK